MKSMNSRPNIVPASPGRDAENLADEDLLREVMNTVGKAGKLGEHVNCVVSVSMLTEGRDTNTVTHVLGVRAFSTQLLCEQVVRRALRRMSYGHYSREVTGEITGPNEKKDGGGQIKPGTYLVGCRCGSTKARGKGSSADQSLAHFCATSSSPS
jgi:hypothetical protein